MDIDLSELKRYYWLLNGRLTHTYTTMTEGAAVQIAETFPGDIVMEVEW